MYTPEELVKELDDIVMSDCVKSTPYTRGKLAVITRLIEQEVNKRA
jgi:hypothetical protein